MLEIYVHWFDASGAQLAATHLHTLDTEGDAVWQEAAGTATAPDGTSAAQVVVYEASGGGATLGLDEVVVRSAQPTPGALERIAEHLGRYFPMSSDEQSDDAHTLGLVWWQIIVGDTVFGERFWTGKGFGVDLVEEDDLIAADGSPRPPPNSHLAILARMGVPGLVLWISLQGAFATGLLATVIRARRSDRGLIAGAGAWVLAYWLAMMVNISFGPYLEQPQSGVWFWSVFGFGMIIIRFSRDASRRSGASHDRRG